MASKIPSPTLPKLSHDRLQFLKTVASPPLVPYINKLQEYSESSDSNALSIVIGSAPAEVVHELAFANSVADLSSHHPELTKALVADPNISSLRDVARNYDNRQLTALVAGGKSEEEQPTAEANGLSPGLAPETLSQKALTPGSSVDSTPATEKDKASAFVAATAGPGPPTKPTETATTPHAIVSFQRKLFSHEPSAVVARMVQDGEIPIATPQPATNGSAPSANPVKDGVVKFFDNNPDFNLRNQSVLTVLSDSKSLDGVPQEHHDEVTKNLKVLQRTQALTHVPEAIPGLANAGMTSAFKVAQIPESNFVANHGEELGSPDVAREIHVHATNTVIRNDHALTSLLQTVRGTGVAMIDAGETRERRIIKAKALAESLPEKVDLSKLFGNMDFCDCDDCNSVTSPAAYFVELLQFLRNNNLHPDNKFTGKATIADTPLDALFKRRPDLGCLELTCANTSTVLPYIDLANEVMESFVVHLKSFATSSDPVVEIDVWNADPNTEGLGGSTGELLAQPQNTNYNAYCILKDAVYPSTKLPFNQPVEATRLFLDFLGTSRAELGERFRGTYTPPTVTKQDGTVNPQSLPPKSDKIRTYSSSSSSCSSSECSSTSDEDTADYADGESCGPSSQSGGVRGTAISVKDQDRLKVLHQKALDRSDDADILHLTEEEYIILTKESFWVKEHFDIRHGTVTPLNVYQQRIGVKPDYAYWGVDYTSTADMLNQNETSQIGLTFVKKQFLPRTGIVYSELVDLLKTEFINPFMLKGRDKVIMESLRLSYSFLKSKVVANAPRERNRYAPLVEYLFSSEWQHILSQFNVTDITTLFAEEVKAAGRCKMHHHHRSCLCRLKEAIREWLCRNFEKMGMIIILESVLEQPKLWFEAYVVAPPPTPAVPKVVLAAATGTAAETPGAIAAGATVGLGIGIGAGTGTGTGTGAILVGGIPVNPIRGTILGRLLSDGRIAPAKEEDPLQWDDTKILATVGLDGVVVLADGTNRKWHEKEPSGTTIQTKDGTTIGHIDDDDSKLIVDQDKGVVRWVGLQDDCNIEKVRLRQLDGCPVGLPAFDRMHRFLRLWRKLGWAMAEVDAALRVLGGPPPAPEPPVTPPPSSTDTPPNPIPAADDDIDWIDFGVSCNLGNCGRQTCKQCQQTLPANGKGRRGKGKGKEYHHRKGYKPKAASTGPDITVAFIHQLVALKKLADLTGLSLLELLAFWGHIDTYGDPPSLYAKLFLTHNMLGIDRVFTADANGNFLVASPLAKIKDHTQIILAALQLKPVDFIDFIKHMNMGSADITIETISTIYRYRLLAKILGVKPAKLDHAFDTLNLKPFESAQKALEFITLWNKISDAGFSFQQLDFVLTTNDDDLRPVGPSQRTLLQATVTLYNGLNDIDAQHPDIGDVSQATSSAVLTNVQLLFSTDVGAKILAFLEGKLPFTTPAPQGLILTIPSDLAAKIKYVDGAESKLQITGQLTEDETAKAKALSGNAKWPPAIDRTARQAATFLKTTLSAVFPVGTEDVTKRELLKGDIPPSTDPKAPNDGTGPGKRLYFLQKFIPFLKSKLADKLIADTMSSAASLDSQVTRDLLTYVLRDVKDPNTSGLDSLKNIKNDASSSQGAWKGYLIPPSTDNYTLVGESDDQPPDITIEGVTISLDGHYPDDDPPNLWASKPMRLTGGRLYNIQLNGLLPTKLKWKTDRTQVTQVPAPALLANYVTTNLKALFVVLWKCGILINGFRLTNEEILYLHNHQADFGTFNWNAVNLLHWNRIADYVKLKQSLPKLEVSLIDFFTWASSPTAKGGLPLIDQIKSLTLWQTEDIQSLLSPKNFNLDNPANFRNEINLIKLQKALDTSTKIGVGIDLLFTWAKPQIDFWKIHDIAESIRNGIRSRYKLSDWEVAIKPTYDKLRQAQSDALVAYLVVQPELVQANVIDADSLFEFLLIDVQMCPCMETSRMKQATSSVQLFIQRCMLGLEDRNGVPLNALDRGRWDWMQRYRVWEANRKVYLYPENWIQPSLRDDKSSIYQQLESDMMQKDLSTDSVMEMMKNYLFKLSEVANLEADALHVEEAPTKEDATKYEVTKIHIFARTRQSPYKFYYRYFDRMAQAWQPWQDMQVDIPHYVIEKPKKTGSTATPPTQGRPEGFYLVPFTFNGRLLVGLPQFMKVQLAQDPPDKSFADIGNNVGNETKATASAPEEYWEIRMGLSELRKGKWTAKVVTADAVVEGISRPNTLPPIGSYQFVTRNIRNNPDGPQVDIDVYRLDDTGSGREAPAFGVGRFSFTGSQFGRAADGPVPTNPFAPTLHWSDFQFQMDRLVTTGDDYLHGRVMFPLQGNDLTQKGLVYGEGELMVRYPTNFVDRRSTITYDGKAPQNFFHPFVEDLLSKVGRTDNLDDLFDYFTNGAGLTDTDTKIDQDKRFDAYGGDRAPGAVFPIYNELSRPNSLYNWELGFHSVMALADRLLRNQQFDLALKMCHYVFNPLSKSDGGGNPDKRYWMWKPFQEVDSLDSMSKLFADLRPNTTAPLGLAGQINQWRDHPFRPHVLARLRPVAYMKFVVMKYIEILIAYGDYYFRQNTLEMIPMAIQCYVLASHIYGKRGQKIPKRGKTQAQTYNSLVNKWDAFDNAMVELELAFPFSNQITTPMGNVSGVVGLANIWGFATMRYFCIPDNPQLRGVRDLIDDRLFKVRHCQDITGVERKLPLYEPAIDPGLLVAAAAAGLSLSSVLNDLNSPLPNFRFPRLLQKALEMCKELKKLGRAFVLAKERKDGEALMALRQNHETVIHTKVLDQKKLSLDEANKAHEGLQQTRKVPEYRMQHTLKQLGEDVSKIPSIGDVEQGFNELVDQIETPIIDSGMKLIAAEKEEIEKAINSLDLKPIVNAIEIVASELHVLPTLNGHASPFGVGIASCWGPPNIAKGIQGAAKAYQMVADWLSHQSSNVSRAQNYVKQNMARVKEANTAGHEVKAIDKQIVTQQVRIAVHQQDITNQQKQIDNAQEVEDFLKDKYTKTELYTWLEQSVSDVYYQTYTMAYELAKKAEAAFRFERGLSSSNFIKFGYWETANSGLMAGERLLLGLKELEAAYHETRGYDFEVTKNVSLRRINPLGLLKLREDGLCDFAIPEVLFDMDFPGHYQRKIRSVAVTIQCSADPFTNINCTLRLTAHKFRFNGISRGKGDYPEKPDEDASRFTTTHIPISSIAVSTADRDSGVFELDFKGERFMPFEGAGAISSWRLELNETFRQFDYETITDVIIHLQYTSLDGGNTLGQAASGYVQDYISHIVDVSDTEGLYAIFDVPRDFPAEWEAFKSGPSPRVLTLNNINERLPVYAKSTPPDKITTKDVWIATEAAIAANTVGITQGGTPLGFSKADGKAGKMNVLHSTDTCSVKSWVVSIGDAAPSMKQFWILVRYSLQV
ncbi:MAG: hypothetical protein M1840_002056 [Geoglossum simile]|nr:MAG: hypothetical protein M1840_002056 [Geoglossum simile]